jgi:hypothetical protein
MGDKKDIKANIIKPLDLLPSYLAKSGERTPKTPKPS